MTAFPSSGGRVFGALGGALTGALLLVGTAAAQSSIGRPIPLIVQPAPEKPAGSTEESSGEKASGDAPVKIEQLESPDPMTAGPLEPADGGFGPDTWRGVSRNVVEALIPRLPLPNDSPTIRSLARRLLLSNARAPEGAPGPVNLLGLRAERLFAAGDVESALALVRGVRSDDRAILRVRIDAALLAGDTATACTDLRSAAAADPSDSQLVKGLGFCRALSGDHTQAAFTTVLLRDAGEKDDPAYTAMLKALAGDTTAAVGSLHAPSALHVAMLTAAKQKVPADAIDGTPPAVLAAIARAPNADPDIRLAAAERGVGAGSLKSDALMRAYKGVSYTPQQLADAPSVAAGLTPAKSNALYFQVAEAQKVPAARAEALALALKAARERDQLATIAHANLAALRAIPPSVELAWFAGLAIPALLAVDDVDGARAWFAMLQKNATPQSPDAAATLLKLMPVVFARDARLAERWDGGPIVLWANALPEIYATPPEQRRHAQLVLSLFEALGMSVPAAAWDPLLGAPTAQTAVIPAAAYVSRLRAAARSKNVGATVLFALLVLGPNGLETAPAEIVADAIGALREVGLEADARALAFEAMLVRDVF